MSGPGDDATPRSATARTVALLFVALAFAGFVALGLWQVQRLHWKHALVARVESRIHAAAVPAPTRDRWPAITAEADEYRHVFVQGRFLQGRDTRVQALTELGAGAWLLSPLRTASGDIVLVNRGFVPDDGAAVPPPTGTVRIEGLLRIDEPNGRVLRRNDAANERWYSRDVAAIARARGLDAVAPYFIDADALPGSDDWPRGGMTVVRFRDHHLQYALTWFALAALCLFAGWRLLRMGVMPGERHLRHHGHDADPDPRQHRRR